MNICIPFSTSRKAVAVGADAHMHSVAFMSTLYTYIYIKLNIRILAVHDDIDGF